MSLLRIGLLLGLATGCSVLVDADPDRLGDESASDMGPRPVDGGDVDAGGGSCEEGCDDGVACTNDQCVGDRCLQAPDDSLCGPDERCDVVAGCVPGTCSTDADCGDDGVACNGTVSCSPEGSCVTSPAVPCDDGNPCTTDRCDPAAGGCVGDPVDADGDGLTAAMVDGMVCEGGVDCDDSDSGKYPGAPEACDGHDQDCDGAIDEGVPGCTGPTGDTCADVVVLPIASDGTASYAASLSAAVADDYDTPCGDGTGRDLVLAVDFTGIADFEIDTSSSDFDTVIAASTECGSFAVGGRGCNDDIQRRGSVLQSRLWVHRVGQIAMPNRLYILVEGYDGDEVGNLVVNVRRTDAAPDSCAGPLDITGGGSVLGFAGGAASPTGGHSGSCMGFGGRFAAEGIFELRPAARRLRLTAWSNQFSPDVYVRLTCEDTELFCERNDNSSGLRETSIDEDLRGDGLPRDINVFVDDAMSGDAYTLDYEP